MLSLNLLVLKTLEPCRLVHFYEQLGVAFVQEQHGRGPIHHAGNVGGLTLEIYPAESSDDTTTSTRLGFRVASLTSAFSLMGDELNVLSPPRDTLHGKRAIVRDPAGHKIELVEG